MKVSSHKLAKSIRRPMPQPTQVVEGKKVKERRRRLKRQWDNWWDAMARDYLDDLLRD
jgi:hypothetical protein